MPNRVAGRQPCLVRLCSGLLPIPFIWFWVFFVIYRDVAKKMISRLFGVISISKIPTSLFSFQFELVISSFSAGEISRHLTLSNIPGYTVQNNLNNWDQRSVPAAAPVLDDHHVFNQINFWVWDIHFGPSLHSKTWSCDTQFQYYTQFAITMAAKWKKKMLSFVGFSQFKDNAKKAKGTF